MTPQFRSGQTVHLCRASYRMSSAGDFKIVRVLPDEGGERQYRIRTMAKRTNGSSTKAIWRASKSRMVIARAPPDRLRGERPAARPVS